MKIYSAIRSFIAVAAFTFIVCDQVNALTVYDVIKLSNKGYSSQDIVTIIEITDSTFALKAEDFPKLRALGVSDTVIRSMLKVKHFEAISNSSTDSAQGESVTPVNTGNNDAPDKVAKPREFATVNFISKKTSTRKGFKAQPFEEADSPTESVQRKLITPVAAGKDVAPDKVAKPTGSASMHLASKKTIDQTGFNGQPFKEADPLTEPVQGKSITRIITDIDAPDRTAKPTGDASMHLGSKKTVARKGFKAQPYEEADAGGHRHSVITLSGIQLFVFRDEGQYSSIAARGIAIVNRLEEAASLGSGTFRPVHIDGKDAVMFFDRHGAHAVVIVSVSEDDAYTYERRSARKVTPELLSAYWSALLSDYWSIAIADESPAKLTNIHEGEALQALHDRLTASGTENRPKLEGILDSLSQQQQEHLLRLSTGIPHEFTPPHGTPRADHP
jgi:hypothetical protein